MTLKYTIVGTDDGSNITVFTGTGQPQVAHSSHPNYDKIVAGVLAQDETVIDLFDVAQSAAAKFNRLTERVTHAHGHLFLDGVEVNNALADQVVRFMEEGVEDYKPLVAFFENVQSNPNEHSREQLYTWLTNNEFSLTPDGLIVGYKGVNVEGDTTLGTVYKSTHSGRAIVNDVVQNGYIQQKVGDVVEMPRNEVTHDPTEGCSHGLHVSNFSYANGYGNATLEVHVNPRDVVSVPTDSSWQKVRACRYTIIGTVEKSYDSAVVYGDDFEDDDFEDDFNDEWGDGEDFQTQEETLFESPLALAEDFAPVADLSETDESVKVGDLFETTDKRRAGTQFKVESIEGDQAVGKSLPSNLTRKVALDRLTSYRYRKV